MKEEENRLAALVALHDQANLALRVAITVAVLWPFGAVSTAVFLRPSNAQTIVPIIELTPLASLLLVIIAAPFAFTVLFTNPLAKQGFLWLCALVGVELSIGVYFAVVPVSNDPRLIPLLILSACAVFFLRIARYAQWLIVLLTLLIIGTTVIFIAGGRAKLLESLRSAPTPAQHASDSSTASTVPQFNPRPCPDSWDNFAHHEHDVVTYFDVVPPLGCKSGLIYVPGAWAEWEYALVGDTNGCEVYLAHQGINPWGPYNVANMPGTTPSTNSAPLSVERASGSSGCKIRVYASKWRIPNPPASSPDASVANAETGPAAEPAAQPSSLEPNWKQAQQFTAEEYAFEVPPCVFRGSNLHCFFKVVNEGEEGLLFFDPNIAGLRARLIDDDGREYPASGFQLGSKTATGNISQVIPSQVPMRGDIFFQKVPFNTTRAAVIEFSGGHGNYYSPRWFKILFENVPIEQKPLN
jgi:hypothetical protein